MTVRVIGRAESRRCILTATRRVRVRRPVVSMDESRRRLVVRDHAGEAAGGVDVAIGHQRYTTQPSGLLELEQPLSDDAMVRVEGIVVVTRL